MASLYPVTKPEDLYGRYKELAQITAALVDGHHVVVEGITRIGKSSVLNVLKHFPGEILRAVLDDLSVSAEGSSVASLSRDEWKEVFARLAERTETDKPLLELYDSGQKFLSGVPKEVNLQDWMSGAAKNISDSDTRSRLQMLAELTEKFSPPETYWHMIFLAWSLSRAARWEWKTVAFDFARDAGERRSTGVFWRNIALQLGCSEYTYQSVVRWTQERYGASSTGRERLLVLLDEYQSRDRFPIELNGELSQWRESGGREKDSVCRCGFWPRISR